MSVDATNKLIQLRQAYICRKCGSLYDQATIKSFENHPKDFKCRNCPGEYWDLSGLVVDQNGDRRTHSSKIGKWYTDHEWAELPEHLS